ncbi:MAG: aminotransferase class I/II-fold pyridoxal phosphate-dependent enzyme [Planctomycetota bacterium]|nr:aminotransferase class I/II-fold pyridoxal phosphate-dependent enzyme [Planctomycetota bacterium]
MTLFDKCRRYTRPREARAAGFYPYFHPISESFAATEVTINEKRMIMIGSNNYLGLTHHPKVMAAAEKAVRDFGTGCSGSRFLNGTLSLHIDLEERLAAFFGKEAALTFSTGFQTNLGVLSVLAGKNDCFFSDRKNHACIVDGMRLSFGTIKKYRHNDMEDLERLLGDAPPDKGKLIVTDGVFSMLGDLSELPRIHELGTKHGCAILVDDAHGVGVLGEGGRGTAAHFGLDVDLITGTFSKSLASLGGFVVGPADVLDFVKHHSRPMIFSAAMTPSNAAAAVAALEVIETEPEHRERLMENVHYMHRGLGELGFNTGEIHSAIIPIHIGSDEDVFMAWRTLFDNGIFTNAVIPPAVPPNQAMIRTSYMATHTREQLDRCLEEFARIGHKLQIV